MVAVDRHLIFQLLDQIESLEAFRQNRNDADVSAALTGLKDALTNGESVMPASIRAALAGVTTGEWADTLRAQFGEYRAPTGVGGAASDVGDPTRLAALRSRSMIRLIRP